MCLAEREGGTQGCADVVHLAGFSKDVGDNDMSMNSGASVSGISGIWA